MILFHRYYLNEREIQSQLKLVKLSKLNIWGKGEQVFQFIKKLIEKGDFVLNLLHNIFIIKA